MVFFCGSKIMRAQRLTLNFPIVKFCRMQPNLERKLKTLTLICLFTSFAGVLYQLIGEERLNYNSVLFGLPLGLGFGLLELFLFAKFEKRFRRWAFTRMLVFKAL